MATSLPTSGSLATRTASVIGLLSMPLSNLRPSTTVSMLSRSNIRGHKGEGPLGWLEEVLITPPYNWMHPNQCQELTLYFNTDEGNNGLDILRVTLDNGSPRVLLTDYISGTVNSNLCFFPEKGNSYH